MPRQVTELIVDLKFANGLPSGFRLSVHDRKYSNFSITESLNRTFWGESRIKTYNWINDLIDRAMDIGKRYPAWQKIIKEHVTDLKQPITILRQTYRDDPNMVTKFETLIYRTQYPLFLIPESQPLDIKENNDNHISAVERDIPGTLSSNPNGRTGLGSPRSYGTALDEQASWVSQDIHKLMEVRDN